MKHKRQLTKRQSDTNLLLKINFTFVAVNSVLASLCYSEYSRNILLRLECRHGDVCVTGQCSTASSITLCSTPVHTSIRRCLELFTSCTFVLQTHCWIVPPHFVINWIEVSKQASKHIYLSTKMTGYQKSHWLNNAGSP